MGRKKAIRKWIGYCRVSTKEQARDGYSLRYQYIKLEEYFIVNKIENYEIITDDGYTGRNENRPGIKKIKRLITQNKVEGVAVLKTDRLHRDIVDQSKFYNNCRKRNTLVVSLTESINFETAMGRAMLNITTTYSQMESETIAERTKQGLVAKAQSGEYPFKGCPYGYKKMENKKLKEVQKEKCVVQFIFKKFYLKPGEIRSLIIDNFKIKLDYNRITQIKKHEDFYLTGMVEVAGSKIKIVDPMVTDIITKNPEKKSYSTRSVEDYRYYNKVYYKGKRMAHKSAYGKCGKKYLYYVSREHGLSISECTINKILQIDNTVPYDDLVKQVTDITVNFIYNKRSITSYIKQLEECREVFIPNNIKKINVIDKENIEVEYYYENIKNEKQRAK